LACKRIHFEQDVSAKHCRSQRYLPLSLPLLSQVLEYLWLLNSHHEWVYKHMHGDKDTFLLAFAMAGRLGDFKQVRAVLAVPCRACRACSNAGVPEHAGRTGCVSQPLLVSSLYPKTAAQVCMRG
jgi:hypothetical protein